MSYSNVMESLDRRYAYSNYNTTPIKRENEVWKISIQTTCYTKNHTVYGSTSARAEKQAYAFIEQFKAQAQKKYEKLMKRLQEEEKEIRRYERKPSKIDDKALQNYIESECPPITKIIIEIIKKDGTTETLSL